MSAPLEVLDGPVGTELLRRGVPTPLPRWSADAIERAPAALGPDHVTTSNMWSALAKIQLDEGDAKGAAR